MDVFHTLAQMAVAVTGFSSLVIIFGGGSSVWTGQHFVTFAFSLSWSIGSIFLSLLPIILVEFGMHLSAAAQYGLFLLVAYMFVIAGALTYARIKLAGNGIGGIRRRLSVGMTLVFLAIVSCALAAGLGLLPGPARAWYATTIVLLLAHATGELGILVVQSMRLPRVG